MNVRWHSWFKTTFKTLSKSNQLFVILLPSVIAIEAILFAAGAVYDMSVKQWHVAWLGLLGALIFLVCSYVLLFFLTWWFTLTDRITTRIFGDHK